MGGFLFSSASQKPGCPWLRRLSRLRCFAHASRPLPSLPQNKKKRRKLSLFLLFFLHGKPVIRRVFYFYRASGCLKSLKRFFMSCCFNQRHLNYRSFVNPTLVFFERKSFFLQKLLILAHGFHQFFVYNL